MLGPNGAGKTTTIEMLSTLLTPTAGTIKINNMDIIKEKKQIRKFISFIFGSERGLYWRLTGKENLLYFADLYDIDKKCAKQRINRLLQIVGLEDAKDILVEKYSKGMKQRLHFARGLLTNPDVIFMDEPTIGLDPEIALEFRKMIIELKERGKTIIYTSHYMHEADSLCDRIAIIKKGKLLTIDTPTRLKENLKTSNIVYIKFNNKVDLEVENLKLIDKNIIILSEDLQSIKLEMPSELNIFELINSVFKKSYVIDIKIKEYTLEDVYLSLVGD